MITFVSSPLLDERRQEMQSLRMEETASAYREVEDLIRRGQIDEACGLFNEHRASIQSSGFRQKHYKKATFEVPTFWGVKGEAIPHLLDACRRAFDHPLAGRFIGTNLISYLKSAHFLFDPKFAIALGSPPPKDGASARLGGTVWNKHIVLTAAANSIEKPGAFVECGTYTGTTAEMICRYCDLEQNQKKFFLFDLFEFADGDTHTKLPEHKSGLYESVLEKFAPYPSVRIVQGRVPDVFSDVCPDQIAFLHVDMNDPIPELLAYHHLFDRMVPGGIIVLDDYGHVGRQDQLMVANAFFESRGRRVFEIPTGQGIVVA